MAFYGLLIANILQIELNHKFHKQMWAAVFTTTNVIAADKLRYDMVND